MGKLPMVAVDSTILSHLVLPVYRAIDYMFSRGEIAPLKWSTIWKIAQAKYNATEEVREFLKAMEGYVLEPVVLDSVCQSLILKKISTLTLEQLATGQPDFDSLRKLLSVSTTINSHIHDIRDLVELAKISLSLISMKLLRKSIATDELNILLANIVVVPLSVAIAESSANKCSILLFNPKYNNCNPMIRTGSASVPNISKVPYRFK